MSNKNVTVFVDFFMEIHPTQILKVSLFSTSHYRI